MFNPNESPARIREFQSKMREDLALLQDLGWEQEQLEQESERAMLQMLEWEEKQHGQKAFV